MASSRLEVATERRAGRRAPLHWPLTIRNGRANAPVLSAITEDLSSHGFSCVLEEPFGPGDRLECVLRFSNPLEAASALRCQAEVIWVKRLGDGRFGIGCRIQDYIVIR